MAMKSEPPDESGQGPAELTPRRSFEWPSFGDTAQQSASTPGSPAGPVEANSLARFHSTLERLLRTATALLSDIAVLYAMSGKVQYDAGGIFSPTHVQVTPDGDVPVAIAKDIYVDEPPRRKRPVGLVSNISPPTSPEKKRKRRKRREFDILGGDSRNVRQDPALQDLKYCPDCGRKGNGSRSQSGLIYYYCRNAGCTGRGSSQDKFIGWSKAPT
eukprot:Gregarina_sp_Poly_1__5060@NODE_2681_length_1832_cov_16_486686_g1702_i0_p3_GENE_NODE_2681_length_1832_cov_16_486686_g1702_i0NODE_2681_length_1832_cov_16_486686_g1702_i0_p3_ORF_typecomplete_len215_score30_43Zn_ribbon_recom/PF13408_6/1_3e04Zn_ribbon_recom/PF13408_6/0_0003Lar_restr_allev/PF14354_6/0_075zftcix/PF14952_6/1_6_NODE_2681_length_1832_cov_16_486686_g1702_i0165809